MPQIERDEREIWSTEEEPHMKRRREIMKAHPEVKELTGPCPYTKYIVALLVAVHFATAYYIATNDLAWW
jgi:sphingolipid delta-4 desaturase